jgi:hypothetical protein
MTERIYMYVHLYIDIIITRFLLQHVSAIDIYHLQEVPLQKGILWC